MIGACKTQTRNSYILVGKTEVNILVEYVVKDWRVHVRAVMNIRVPKQKHTCLTS